MSINEYSYQSERSKCLYFGKYKLTFDSESLIISDGKTSKRIYFDQHDSFDPKTTIASVPFINNETIEFRDSTVDDSIIAILNEIIYLIDFATTNFKIIDSIELLKPLKINDKIIDGVAGKHEHVNLMSLEYYEEHKEELKGEKGERGEKGDKGEKGDTGPQGIPGRDGLDGKDGEDGASARGWIWDLINTGLTAASFAALQYQVTQLSAFMAKAEGLDTLRAVLNTISTGNDVFSSLSTWIQRIDDFTHTMTGIVNGLEDSI